MRRTDINGFFEAGSLGTLISAFLHFTVSTTVWVMLGSLAIHLAETFSLSPLQTALIVATPLLTGSLLRIPLGLASDLFGARKTGILGLVLTLIPLLLGWFGAQSIEAIFMIGVLLGVAGSSFAVAIPMASRAYPRQYQGLVMGIVGAGNSGTVISTLFAPRLAEHLGWHGVFGVAMIPILLTLVVFHFAARAQPQTLSQQTLTGYLAVLKEKDSWWFSLFYMVTFGGFVGLASFLIFFFYDQYGVSKIMAGNLTALCVFAGSFMRPLGGLLADRCGGIKSLLGLYAVIAGVMFLVSQLPPLSWAVSALILGMAVMGMGNGAVFQLVPQRFQKEIGVVTGLAGAAGGLGGFLLPFFLGLSKDFTGSYGAGFALLAITAMVCMLLLAYLQRGWRREWAREELGVSF
jgi:NNP family nitrate/nitrite transporter-like MFS transporter